jgi:hypothetical protein
MATARNDQSAIVMVNHREMAKYNPQDPGGELKHIVIGVERHPPRAEDVKERVKEIAEELRLVRPDFFIDATTGTGASLVQQLDVERKKRGDWPVGVHRAHAYIQRGVARQGLVEAILTAYGTGMLEFEANLANRDQLEKALASRHSIVAADGRVSRVGSDDNLIIALGLALAYTRYGAPAEYQTRTGQIVLSRAFTPEPY